MSWCFTMMLRDAGGPEGTLEGPLALVPMVGAGALGRSRAPRASTSGTSHARSPCCLWEAFAVGLAFPGAAVWSEGSKYTCSTICDHHDANGEHRNALDGEDDNTENCTVG